MSRSSSKKVLVVGAGPGGLASAMLLAGAGFSVTLVEKKDRPGGRMGRIEEEGYAFDTGPTILQLPQILDQIFSRAGLKREDYIELRSLSPNTRVHFWDGSFLDTFSDREKNRREWARFVEGGEKKFDAFLDDHRKKYRVAYDTFIAADASRARDYFHPLRLLPAVPYRPWESLHRSLSRVVEDERIVYALSYPSKYLGLHATNCSSVFSVIPYLEFEFGVHHPVGGFRALADAMLRAFTDLGGTFVPNAEVVGVEQGEDGIRGVRLRSGETLFGDEMILNADWAYANRQIFGADVAPVDVESRKYSCSCFMMYLGIDQSFAHLPHHMIYLSDAVKRTDRAALEDRTLNEEDPPFYVCNPGATETTSAPPGHSALYVLVPIPNTSQPVDWANRTEPFFKRMLPHLSKVGLPNDLEKHIRFKRVFTAETWRDDFSVHRGAVFNLSHNWTQLGPMRPKSLDPRFDNLHWVGGGTHPGSGLLTIFESANIAAASISKKYGRPIDPSIAPLPELTR